MTTIYYIAKVEAGYGIVTSTEYESWPQYARNRTELLASCISEGKAEHIAQFLPKEWKPTKHYARQDTTMDRRPIVDVTPKRKPQAVRPPGANWERREWNTYHFGTTIAKIPGAEWERSKPAKESRIPVVAHYVTPALQSLTTGIFAAIAGGTLSGLQSKVNLNKWGVAALCFALAAGATWWVLLNNHLGLLWEVETIKGMQKENDESEERSEPERKKLVDDGPRIYRPNARKLGSSEDWRYFLDQLQRGRLTARQWTGEEEGWKSARFPSGIDVQDAWRFHCHEMVRLGCATREYQTAPLEVVMRWEKVYHRVFG